MPKRYRDRIDRVLSTLPGVRAEDAWVGMRWRVRSATVAHVFGGDDGLFRITFRGYPDEVMAFEQMGPPYFRSGWGDNVIGLIIDDDTDWTEVAELLTDSHRIQTTPAPKSRSPK